MLLFLVRKWFLKLKASRQDQAGFAEKGAKETRLPTHPHASPRTPTPLSPPPSPPSPPPSQSPTPTPSYCPPPPPPRTSFLQPCFMDSPVCACWDGLWGSDAGWDSPRKGPWPWQQTATPRWTRTSFERGRFSAKSSPPPPPGCCLQQLRQGGPRPVLTSLPAQHF